MLIMHLQPSDTVWIFLEGCVLGSFRPGRRVTVDFDSRSPLVYRRAEELNLTQQIAVEDWKKNNAKTS